MEHVKDITTREFADSIRVVPDTIRRGYCVNGHYMNIRPLKLPNGRLLWPREQVSKVLEAAQ